MLPKKKQIQKQQLIKKMVNNNRENNIFRLYNSHAIELYKEEVVYINFIRYSFYRINKRNRVLQLNSPEFNAEYNTLDTIQKGIMAIHKINNKHRQTICDALEEKNKDGASPAMRSIKNSMPELRALNAFAEDKVKIINVLLTEMEITASVEAECISVEANAELTVEEMLDLANTTTKYAEIYAEIHAKLHTIQTEIHSSRIEAARVESAQTSTTTMPQYTNVVAITKPTNTSEAEEAAYAVNIIALKQ